jgi:hypothetical protein
MTQARGVVTTVEAARTMALLATETSAQEAAMAWDSRNLHIRDAEDQATLVEGEALEQVS